MFILLAVCNQLTVCKTPTYWQYEDNVYFVVSMKTLFVLLEVCIHFYFVSMKTMFILLEV